LQRLAIAAAAAAVAALALGCAELPYVLTVAAGEIDVLLHTEPIDDVLARGALEAEQERKLRLVVEARDFARDELGLNVADSFMLFHDTRGQTLAYNLSVFRQDSLTPYIWRFPFVGEISYLGFFALDEARRAAESYQADGYDTWIRSVDAFSTLGYLPDPVHSTLLERSDFSLVDTVIHEVAHNTIYAAGRSDFNESSAMFLGRIGAERFYERLGTDGAATIAAMRLWYADQDRVTAWLLETIEALDAYYAQEIPRGVKLAGRDAVYQAARDRFLQDVLPTLSDPEHYRGWQTLPTNNAYIGQIRTYHVDLDVMAAVYAELGGDFGRTLDELRAAAASGDPFAYLRQLAAAP